jgi:hypothetical protein
MPKQSPRLDAARKTYREALEVARNSPTSEAWAKLLAAGRELSAAQDPRSRGRRSRRSSSHPGDPAEPIERGGDGAE